jgi:hypothetical protein
MGAVIECFNRVENLVRRVLRARRAFIIRDFISFILTDIDACKPKN